MKYPEELALGQSAGRPAWQRGLNEWQLAHIDRLANAAYRSEEAMRDYIAVTDSLRSLGGPSEPSSNR